MKNNSIRIIKRLVLVVVVILLVIGGLWAIIGSLVSSAAQADRLLEEDGELLRKAVQRIENSEERVYFHRLYASAETQDEELNRIVNQLFNSVYTIISRSDNSIVFTRWTRWKDFGAGLAYSLDEDNEPFVEYSKTVTPLSESQWYYFEAN